MGEFTKFFLNDMFQSLDLIILIFVNYRIFLLLL